MKNKHFFTKGFIPWNKGVMKTTRKYTYPYAYEHKCTYCDRDIIIKNIKDRLNAKRWGIKKFCSNSCKTSWRNKNVPQSEHQRKLSSERAKKNFTGFKRTLENKLKLALANIGEKSHFWKGGHVALTRRIRNSNQYIEWREKVLERDNYTCQNCGEKNGKGYSVILQVDHTIPFSKLFNEFISLQEDSKYEKALLYAPFWDINNGRSLCDICHQATTTYSYKANLVKTNPQGNGIYLTPQQKKLIEMRKQKKPARSGICKNCGKITRFRTRYEMLGFCTKYCHDQSNQLGSFALVKSNPSYKIFKCIVCNRDYVTKRNNSELCSTRCAAIYRERAKKQNIIIKMT